MRALLLAALVLLASPGVAAADPPADWSPDVSAARAYLRDRAGDASFHVRTESDRWGLDPDRAFASASVVKAMMLIAYLQRPDVRRRSLRAADHRMLDPMIRHSSNPAANRVYGIVGAEGLLSVAEQAGMKHFTTGPVWGLSRITARDQTRLWIRYEKFVPKRHRHAAMKLLRTIVAPHRWGIGAVPLPAGWKLYFKGGWGSGTGLINHQVALLRRGKERVAVAILTGRNPSHRYGTETVRGVAARLMGGLP
jgi:Beta-lactamase enzyme family